MTIEQLLCAWQPLKHSESSCKQTALLKHCGKGYLKRKPVKTLVGWMLESWMLIESIQKKTEEGNLLRMMP